ncbi:MAG: adenylate/guanylate cyclase domain-containing protein, partial [Acidimicrobiales bacterium]
PETSVLDRWVILANIIGAALVAGYQMLVGPRGGADATEARNDGLVVLVVLVAYISVYAPLARWSSRRLAEGINTWLYARRDPTPEERDAVFAYPGVVAAHVMAGWVGAAMVFGSLSAFVLDIPGADSIQMVVSVLLGGCTTTAICYLAVERFQRPVYALALRAAPPERSRTVGVRPRLLVGWALGSGVPLLMIAIAPIGLDEQERAQLTLATVFVAAAGLVVGFLVTRSAAQSVADPLGAVRDGLARVAAGDLDTTVTVDDGGEVGLVQAGLNEMVSGLRERQRLQDLFGRHVGVEVARAALAQGVRLGGELREASVLFVDLVGSTTLARRLPPDAVVAILNRVFSAVVEAATAEGGWVNKFEGDAALCVFGPPGDQRDHAAAALRAACRLRAALAGLGSDGPATIDAGIGVSTGDVVAGNVGAEARYEYTVIGDPVNEAARLTELAKDHPSRVLASGVCVAAAEGRAGRWCLVQDVVLRGRDEPTALFAPQNDERTP